MSSLAIRQALTPIPISSRAAISPEKSCAEANAAHPTTANASIANCTRLGPYRSSALPSGNCVAAKPRK